MKDLEEGLRDALRDERWSLPVPADAVDVVEAGARRVRRRRRTGLVAGAVAAVLAAGLGVSALRTSSDGTDPATPRPAPRLEVVTKVDQGTSDAIQFDGSIYLSTDTGKVLRVSPTTGRTLMTRDLHPYEGFLKGVTEPGSPVVSGGHLWVATHSELLRLDPVTLQVTRTVPFPKPPGLLEPPTSVIASPAAFWISFSRGPVFRLDGATGAITAKLTVTGNLPTGYPSELGLISADDKANVVWMFDDGLIGDDPRSMILMAAKVARGRLEVIGSMVFTKSGNSSGELTPGLDGSLWAAGATSVAHYAPQAAGRGLRSLPIGGFPVAEWVTNGAQLGNTSNGTRLWIAMTNSVQTAGTLLCLDGLTGTVLEHYPLPVYHGGTFLPGTGDTHQVLIQPGGHLFRLRGPDRCLT